MTSPKLDTRTKNWINQGRGRGTGKDYKPWITIRDVPSSGRSHRILGIRTQRIHHLLSDKELAAFLIFDWKQSITDLREQFPLKIEETIEIAEELGIKHPQIRGYQQIMSTDFLVDTSSQELPRFAVQVKTSSALQEPRTIEKLEIERRYWERKGLPWFLLTERQIPKAVFANLQWLYPAQHETDISEDDFDYVHIFVDFFRKKPNLKISQLAMLIDKAYSLKPGESLRIFRTLLANRTFQFDINRPLTELLLKDLQVSSDLKLIQDEYAANQ